MFSYFSKFTASCYGLLLYQRREDKLYSHVLYWLLGEGHCKVPITFNCFLDIRMYSLILSHFEELL